MKTILLLSLFFVISVLLFAQTEPQPKQQYPDRLGQFEISPEFKLHRPDSLVLSDTLPGMPEAYVYPGIRMPGRDVDPFRMPIMVVSPNFPANMPVMVPDSSVHYYIKQATPVPLPKKK